MSRKLRIEYPGAMYHVMNRGDQRQDMSDPTTVFRAQVPARRLRRAQRILHRLGLSPAEAVNMLLAQIELRKGLPFDVSMAPKPLLSADEQAAAWTEAFGAY
jgi:addiction module RelB/DinJ family antitoxin